MKPLLFGLFLLNAVCITINVHLGHPLLALFNAFACGVTLSGSFLRKDPS